VHRRWVVREVTHEAREELSGVLAVPELVGSVLAARGILDLETAQSFLLPTLSKLPDPALIPGLPQAVDRLARAARASETVWIYTDYDVDGVTSAALLRQFFQQNRIPHRIWLPRRDREGYGLHPDALKEIAAQRGTLVVTADCGVNAVAQAELARALGIDLVITDHHTPGSTTPGACAVVNPKLPGSEYPDGMLAGVGVAWNLAAGLRRRLREEGHYGDRAEPDLRGLLDLVALGTVADLAPLRDVNRVLVSFGLQRLNRSPRPGIAALREVARLKGEIRAGHIGFQIGPRLNAAGRMLGPEEALDLLTSADLAEARSLAQLLDDLNRKRQAEERAILEAATTRVDQEGWWPERWSLVVECEGWHPGVIGIVASRLVERYHRPTVVLSLDGGQAKGSARSIRGLNLFDALTDCESLLDRYGGHAGAAGLTLPADRIQAFRERFEETARRRLTEDALIPVLQLDAEADFPDLKLETVRGLERLEPFGFGNPSPLFLTRSVAVLDARTLGVEAEHVKFRLEQRGLRFDALGWRKAEGLRHIAPGMVLDVAHVPQVSRWNGRETVQLVLEGARPVVG
jgi:single-stranded-DNA-specific exonuclease